MSQEKISIIVPLYNNELYISKCIDSILKQTYKNYELIIVDDGSTDKGPILCQNFFLDNRVYLYTKKNGGLSSARNYGLSKCSCDSQYVVFIDSDDFVSESYLDDLYNNRGELTICNIANIYSDNIYQYKCSEYTVNRFSNLKNNAEFAKFLSTGLFNSACNKLYSTKIIRENNLQYKNIEIAEDIEFNIQYLKYCKEIIYIDKSLYYYVHRDGSLTSKVSTQMYENYISIHKQLLIIFNKTLSKYINQFVYHQYLSISLRFIKKKEYNIVSSYIKNKFVKKSINDYSCSCLGEYILHILYKFNLLRLIHLIFYR